jgi:hypothetical protein
MAETSTADGERSCLEFARDAACSLSRSRGRIGTGALSKLTTEMGPKKSERRVSHETRYPIAGRIHASRRRSAASPHCRRVARVRTGCCRLPLPLAGEGRGGGAQQTKSEMGPKKSERPVSRETLYAVATAFFRRASRRRYAARIPSAAGVKPSSRPACPTVRGRAASSFERASLESPGTSA